MKYYKTPLNEVTRWEILRRSQRESPERYKKKQFYKAYVAKDFENVDFEKLFTTDTFVWKSIVGDYIVTVSFEGAFQNLYYEVRNWSGVNRYKRITLKMLTNCLSKALDTEDLYLNCSCPDFCLHEDTVIKLLNGDTVSIKDMCEKFNNGEDIWVYSVDSNGDFKPGHVSDVWVSGQASDMIEITLDNGKTIITTPNHRYMLRNGDYLEAENLKVGQSLMPLYFKYYKGYENVMLNSKPKSFVSVYKTVAESVLLNDIEEAKIRSGENDIAIHHADFNKLNNYPSNLKPMGVLEHWKYHSDHVLENPELMQKFIAGGRKYWDSDDGRKRKSEEMHSTMRNYWDNMTDEERAKHIMESHEWQRTPEGHEKLSEARKKHWQNLSDEEYNRRRIVFGKNLNGENGEKASKRVKESWARLTPEERQNRINICLNNLKDAKITEACIEARRENGKKAALNNLINHGMEIISILLQNNLEINEGNYNIYRKSGYPHFETIKKYGLLDNINHKIVNIRHIHYDEPINVYDMTVDDYENFYVDAGVILHNCYRFHYWLSQADAVYGVKQSVAPKVRNVKNNKGYVCKHLLAVLFGKRWVAAAAKAWYNFIQANPELAEELIWG